MFKLAHGAREDSMSYALPAPAQCHHITGTARDWAPPHYSGPQQNYGFSRCYLRSTSALRGHVMLRATSDKQTATEQTAEVQHPFSVSTAPPPPGGGCTPHACTAPM